MSYNFSVESRMKSLLDDCLPCFFVRRSVLKKGSNLKQFQERLIERSLMICKIMKMNLQVDDKFASLLIVISKNRIVKTSLQMKSN